jgi:small subunit ribosomal protein S13
MARIAGVDIPNDKQIAVSLTYIYGIGRTQAQKILAQTNVDPTARVRDLTDEEINRVREVIDKGHVVEGDLRREVRQNIQRMVEINCYRGVRHRRGLPVHGQRTRTNARTKRGVRRTVAGKRRAIAKK